MSGRKKAEEEKKVEGRESPSKVRVEDRRSSVGAKPDGEARPDHGPVEEAKEPPERKAALERDHVEEAKGTPAEDERYLEVIDQMKRIQAEFENYRKRVQKERMESRNLAKKEMIAALLPFIDDMQRVTEWGDEEVDIRPLFEGVKLTAKKLLAVLEEEGFERIEALGKPFDPHYHEALLTEEVEDPEKDNIVREVLLDGYTFKGSLLRPARVKVFRHKGSAAGESKEEAGEPQSPSPGGPQEH